MLETKLSCPWISDSQIDRVNPTFKGNSNFHSYPLEVKFEEIIETITLRLPISWSFMIKNNFLFLPCILQHKNYHYNVE